MSVKSTTEKPKIPQETELTPIARKPGGSDPIPVTTKKGEKSEKERMKEALEILRLL